ncbi:MAG: hypothetical protein Q9210_007012, partial [Variospora velana]
METAIRWSSRSTVEEQHFLLVNIAEPTFIHCRVESYDGGELKYDTISTKGNVPTFRAFDWSSHDESILAVGEWSGSATVLKLDGEQSSPLSLPVKSQRPVNAVSFAKTGLLAVGLERVRNDSSLHIWDVEHRVLASSSSPRRTSLEPVRKYASSEGITSTEYFQHQPDTLVAGVKGACIRLYDLRENTGNPINQFPTTSVHNISIDPLNENYFASTGTQKDTTIHIWDRRVGSLSSAACLGSGSGQNAQSGPVIEYRRAFELPTSSALPYIRSLRYCRGESGYLGALASNGDFKVFETKQTYGSRTNELDQSISMNHGQSSVQSKLRTERVHHFAPAADNQRYHRVDIPHIVAFDFTNLAGPKGRPSALAVHSDRSIGVYELQGRPPACALSTAGHLIGSAIAYGPKAGLSTQDDVFTSAGLLHVMPSTKSPVEKPSTASERLDEPTTPRKELVQKQCHERKERPSSRENHEQWFEDYYLYRIDTVGTALATLDVSRRRCVQGYLFDCQKNMSLNAEDPWLRDMWEWIGRAKRLAVEESLIVRGIDLSYLGVYNIWNDDLGKSNQALSMNIAKKLSVGTEKSIRISGMSGNPDILYAIEAICRRLDLPDLTSVKSSLPAHRRLCLHLCGFGLSREELDASTEALAGQGRHTKAAALALAHGDLKKALVALRNGSTSTHRELSLALAGFSRGTNDESWTSTIASIETSIPSIDVYALAILTYVRTGSWPSVLAETYLPLYYRIGVALLYLPDPDLTTYISTLTTECIHHGDIEGLPLTGLSEQAVPLFQNYILKYHDLQSAILAISHTSPRYFPSPLVDIWRAEYRHRLNAHRLFIPRVRFDAGATKLSSSATASSNGSKQQSPALAPAARQVSLKCNNCDSALDRNPAHVSSTSAPLAPPTTTRTAGSIFTDHRAGTVCPKCGKHMPRCVVCMLWLGMPDPHSKGGAQASAEKVGGDGKGKGRGRQLMQDF